MERKLFKKFNLKEARINLTPCDDMINKAAAVEGQEMTIIEANRNGIIYVASEYVSEDQINIICPSLDGSLGDQTCGLRVFIPSQMTGPDGVFVFSQDDLDSQAIIVPIQQAELKSSNCFLLSPEVDSQVKIITSDDTSFVSCLPGSIGKTASQVDSLLGIPTPNWPSFAASAISSSCDVTLHNDVMLGGELPGSTLRGPDDDDLLGELRSFVAPRSDTISDVVNDLSHTELGFDWNGELEWNLGQPPATDVPQINDAEKLNEEFSKKMKEEYAASVIKNSLKKLKKKMSNIKCLKKNEADNLMNTEEKIELESDKKSEKCKPSRDDDDEDEEEEEVGVRVVNENLKRKQTITNDPLSNKKVKRCVSREKNSKIIQATKIKISPERLSDKKVLKKAKQDCRDETKRSFNNTGKLPVKRRDESSDVKKDLCRGPGCKKSALTGTVYCGDECIEAHVQHSLQLLHGKQNIEQLKDAERVVVLERKSGKLITGPLAPTASTLFTWIQKHPSFEVLQPKQLASSQRNVRKTSFLEEFANSRSSKEKKDMISKIFREKQAITHKSGIDSKRINARRHILQILLSKLTENVMVTTSEVKHLAIDLENELFMQHNSVDHFYQQHYQGLVKLLKDSSDEVLNGEKSLLDLLKSATLSTEDILSSDKITSRHDQHVYDINCQICNPPASIETKLEASKSTLKKSSSPSRIFSPDVTSTTDVDRNVTSNAGIVQNHWSEQWPLITRFACDADLKPSSSNIISPVASLPFKSIPNEILTDTVWSGYLGAKDLMSFHLSAVRTSGSMKLIKKNFPSSITIMGRITEEVIEDYVKRIKDQYSLTKEVAVICFSSDEKRKENYKSLFNYLHSRKRCGVVGSIGSSIKDLYVWPLSSSSAIPSFLTPFDGPGLEVNRGDVLLGIIIQQAPPPPLPQDNIIAVPSHEEPVLLEGSPEHDFDERSIITGSYSTFRSHSQISEKQVSTSTIVTASPVLSNEQPKKFIPASGDDDDDDLPYDPEADCLYQVPGDEECDDEDDEINKKFTMVIETLSKKPDLQEPTSNNDLHQLASSCRNMNKHGETNCSIPVNREHHGVSNETVVEEDLSSSSNQTKTSQNSSTEIPNCQAATEALASLNVLLESYIARTHKPQVESSNELSDFQNFNITNEQQTLMKQVLEIVKNKTVDLSQNSGQSSQEFSSHQNNQPCYNDAKSDASNVFRTLESSQSQIHDGLDKMCGSQWKDSSENAAVSIQNDKLHTLSLSSIPKFSSVPHNKSFLQKQNERTPQSWDWCQSTENEVYHDFLPRQRSSFNPVRLEYNHQTRNFPAPVEANRKDYWNGMDERNPSGCYERKGFMGSCNKNEPNRPFNYRRDFNQGHQQRKFFRYENQPYWKSRHNYQK